MGSVIMPGKPGKDNYKDRRPGTFNSGNDTKSSKPRKIKRSNESKG